MRGIPALALLFAMILSVGPVMAQEKSKIDDELIGRIYRAIRADDQKLVKELMRQHSGALKSSDWLEDATELGNLEMVKLLHGMGLDVNGPNPKGPGPLWHAVREGHLETARWLLENGADPDQYEPIAGPARKGNLPLVKLLLKHGANLHARWGGDDDKSFNALAIADAYGQREMVEYLREQGAVMPDEGGTGKGAKKIRKLSLEEEIVAHMTKHAGQPEKLAQRQIVPGAVSIAIHVIKPTKERPTYVLFTTGMSEQPMTAPAGEKDFLYAELTMQLPADWPMTPDDLKKPENAWPFVWLRKIGNYPFQHDTWLGGKFTIVANDDPPRPLAPKVPFTCLLCAARLSDFPSFQAADGRVVELYAVAPLFTEERELEKRQGIYALFRALDRIGSETVVDLKRRNAAK